MNILTGYLSTTSGAAYVNGINILDDPIAAKRLIGFLPEQPPLYPEMTVLEFLRFVYELKGCELPRDAHIEEVMTKAKLLDVKNRLIKNLSKGYRQRVGIAEALIGDPKLIIFDEPTVGLDPKQILEVRNLIRSLGGDHTVILSTHILAEVQAVCERVVIINRGKIIADAKTDELRRTIEDGFRYEIKICGPQREVELSLAKVNGVRRANATGEREADAFVFNVESERGQDARRAIFALCSSKNWPIIGLSPIGTDLESIFIRLVDDSNGDAVKPEAKRRRAH
jgi:ABC-2 type transport system ATP-binding protein